MILSLRCATGDDCQHLIDIDLKCFEFPWNADFWGWAGANYSIFVVTHYDQPVGFACYCICDSGYCRSRVMVLNKVAVKSAYRGHGIGNMLVEAVQRMALSADLMLMETIIPESLCRPGEPDDVTGFFQKLGYRAVAPLVRDCFEYCGGLEDGIRFIRNLKDTI